MRERWLHFLRFSASGSRGAALQHTAMEDGKDTSCKVDQSTTPRNIDAIIRWKASWIIVQGLGADSTWRPLPCDEDDVNFFTGLEVVPFSRENCSWRLFLLASKPTSSITAEDAKSALGGKAKGLMPRARCCNFEKIDPLLARDPYVEAGFLTCVGCAIWQSCEREKSNIYIYMYIQFQCPMPVPRRCPRLIFQKFPVRLHHIGRTNEAIFGPGTQVRPETEMNNLMIRSRPTQHYRWYGWLRQFSSMCFSALPFRKWAKSDIFLVDRSQIEIFPKSVYICLYIYII